MFVNTLAWRTTTWLAIAAVMMLFIAPWVSKSIMQQTHCSHASPPVYATQAMTHDMPQQMSVPGSCLPVFEYSMMSGQVMSPTEEIACGYCQLLIHLPFILFVLTFLLWLLLHFVIPLFATALFFSWLFHPWEPQRARAPPAVFQY
ncbi:DUF2946 domain-containing protein [uncultured Cedecea sp.]|uniref:DUF2946 domain-containing protein n=1 Tax=uncultured Cedecea sp. TaxID=988762 RepID=UPI0026111959|nr:DUF2946 domain-containing protein [uncultured Cedecea sp.]